MYNEIIIEEECKEVFSKKWIQYNDETNLDLAEILFITTYPPRECGIATYSQDLIKALKNKFGNSFTINICPIESDQQHNIYPKEIQHILNINYPKAFETLSQKINNNSNIKLVVIQHEFGLFEKAEIDFIHLITSINVPIITAFHTVLPNPNEKIKLLVNTIINISAAVIVMTNNSKNILLENYSTPSEKVNVIPHGTHLVLHSNKNQLKEKYHFKGRKVLSTFGLISSGKSIETTLEALPEIIKINPDVIFLIIGKTHPSIIQNEGEQYRIMLQNKISDLQLKDHVIFINRFLPLPELLEFLQLTDIYLFTSKDPNQAVSGTFSYAISCGCPIVSTPIPHAKEVLKNEVGLLIDFENVSQLTNAVNKLLREETFRNQLGQNSLQLMAQSAWENSAIAHTQLFENLSNSQIRLHYNLPEINLQHFKELTTTFGMIQFSKINQPDLESGYTLDDNARAMIAMCLHFEKTGNKEDLQLISIYLNFITYCIQPKGSFLNYVDQQKIFTLQNLSTNLEDANGRAIWALGYLLSMSNLLPAKMIMEAEKVFDLAINKIHTIHSTRAMSFIIKGLYYKNLNAYSVENITMIEHFADKIVQMYKHEAEEDWQWFEHYLTYANSVIPEAILCAYLATDKLIYRIVAKKSFEFLLSKIFTHNRIRVISNKCWLHKGNENAPISSGGEQPIDVAYTIIALQKFYKTFHKESYLLKMKIAFNWFLGENHLHQIIYNPCTGGCYDGVEENNMNLNQGAESTVSYLLSRMIVEKTLNENIPVIENKFFQFNKS